MQRLSVRRAVVIFPSDADTTAVECFRAGWDPMSPHLSAHITVVFPFQTRSDPAALRSAITDVAGRHTCFSVDLADPAIHDQEYLFLAARCGGDQIRRLHIDLYTALADAHIATPFTPHMTIGRQHERTHIDRALRAARRLNLHLRGTARQLTLYRIDNTGRHVECVAALVQLSTPSATGERMSMEKRSSGAAVRRLQPQPSRRNARLRAAMRERDVTFRQLADVGRCHIKTTQRWLYEGRRPEPERATAIARYLHIDEAWLWSRADRPPTAELIKLYPTSSDIPQSTWAICARAAQHSIDIAATPDINLDNLTDILAAKAIQGVSVRLCLAEPDLPRPPIPAVQTRSSSSPHTVGIYRIDSEAFVFLNCEGAPRTPPALYLRRAQRNGIFDFYTSVFTSVWADSESPSHHDGDPMGADTHDDRPLPPDSQHLTTRGHIDAAAHVSTGQSQRKESDQSRPPRMPTCRGIASLAAAIAITGGQQPDPATGYRLITPWAPAIVLVATVVTVVVVYMRNQQWPGALLRTYGAGVRPQLLPDKPQSSRRRLIRAVVVAAAALTAAALIGVSTHC
jgi:2'-5' RNA ligase